MTEKRFRVINYSDGSGMYGVSDRIAEITVAWDKSKLIMDNLCDLLNHLHEENEQLKFERDRYKRLSEIRQESINNRILTIKEFIDNCSDKEVKKTLEQLFHSEVKEYELSKKIRKLEKENEQLKKENYGLHKKLGDFEPFEEHIQERTSKTSVNDIIGLVKTDEPTNSVELKKELYK